MVATPSNRRLDHVRGPTMIVVGVLAVAGIVGAAGAFVGTSSEREPLAPISVSVPRPVPQAPPPVGESALPVVPPRIPPPSAPPPSVPPPSAPVPSVPALPIVPDGVPAPPPANDRIFDDDYGDDDDDDDDYGDDDDDDGDDDDDDGD